MTPMIIPKFKIGDRIRHNIALDYTYEVLSYVGTSYYLKVFYRGAETSAGGYEISRVDAHCRLIVEEKPEPPVVRRMLPRRRALDL